MSTPVPTGPRADSRQEAARRAVLYVAVSVVVALVATQCGVTTPGRTSAAGPGDSVSGPGTSSSRGPDGGSGPRRPGQQTAPGAAGGKTSAGGSPSTGTAPVRPGPGSPGLGGRTGGGTGSNPVSTVYGRGVTSSTISVGLVYPLGTDTGASGASAAGEQTIMKTIIDAFNTRGGIAGRKIVPVYYANDENSSKTYAQREQERCAVFTEDHKVFAVYPGYTTSENEAACLQKTGTLLVVPNNSANASGRFDTTSFKQFPNLYEPVTPNADRMFSTMVKRLNAAGYFDKGAKIGLLYTSDAATKRAVDRSLKPALAALGLKADQEASVLSPYNLNDLAPTESQIQSAELHFAAAGITHVIIPTGLGSLISGGFMKTAASQNYKPRYGLESGSIGVETEAFSGTDVTDQLHRAVYMGWDPYGDVRDEAATAPMRVCNAISHKAGMPTDARAMGLCDFLSILDSGLSHASQPTQQAFASGLSRAGTVAMTRTYSTDYSSGRRDGAARVRMAHYDFSCHAAGNKFCWRYDTPQVRF